MISNFTSRSHFNVTLFEIIYESTNFRFECCEFSFPKYTQIYIIYIIISRIS